MLNSNSGGNNVSNPLDSLMMAYADLSGNSRGSSFKGPPLSQVVVTKQAAPAFTPSSKARDWSSLEQALEDAFVSSPNQKTQPNPSPSLWESSKIESTLNASSGTLLDDWGDFQDFKSAEPAGPVATPAFFLQGGSTASAVIADDDDFSDFVTAPAQQNAGSSNSVGSRLASFQEESPVHNFKWRKEPLPTLPDSPSRFDAFFGAEEDYTTTVPQTILGQPINLPSTSRTDDEVCQRSDPPIVLPLSGNNLGKANITNIFTNSILGQPPLPASSLPQASQSESHIFGHLPSPPAPSADKYGALADLFSNPDPTNISSLLSPSNPISNQDAKEKSSLSEDLFGLSNPVESSSALKIDPVEKEEDFGDFIAVTQDNPTETFSFPLPVQDDFKAVNNQDHLAELSLNLSSHCQGQVSSMPSIFPSSVNTMVIPWYESSPPPLPPDIDDEDNCDEFNTSGSLPLSSGNDDFLEEDSIFKTSLPTVDQLPVPPSDLDTLSVNTLDESTPSPDEEVLPQPLSEPEVEPPASMDIESKIPHLFDQLTSPYREWSQAAYQILEIISNAADTFSNITDKDVLDEVIESQEGLNYLQNLVEVYRVFKRIQQSYSMAVWNPTVQSQCEDAEKAWKGLLVHLKLYIDVIPSRSVFDFSDCMVSSKGLEVTFCAICLLDLRRSSKETIGVVKESIISIEQKNYHSTCANFWVNCVNPSLPKLELTN